MLRRLILAAAAACLAAPALAQGDPSFNLVNRSGQAINEIYVTPVTQQNWGRDLLGTAVLPNGQSFAVRIAPAAGCRQDVRVVYADRRPEERRNVDTCVIAEMVFGAAAPAPAPGPQARPGPAGPVPARNPSFNLVNQGPQPIREVYVSSVRQDDWGQQRLSQPLQPGAYLGVSLPQDDCVNDVRVVWQDGRREDRRQVDTCSTINMVFR